MRIGIDVRYLSHGLVGGVHTYVTHFVRALLAQAHEHEIFLYADTKRPFEILDLPRYVQLRLLPYRNGVSSVQLDLFMNRTMERDRLDVVHFPANYGFGPRGVPSVITLHDAINILPLREIIRGHPKNVRTIGMMTYLHLMSTQSVRQASLLLTVSEHARQEIARVSGIDLQRIVAVHHAPTPDLRRVTDERRLADVRARHAIKRPFVLADGLKNPAVLIRAWRLLAPALRDKYEIIFFSRRPDPLPIIHEAVTEGIARLLVRPSREDLIALFSMAHAFVFPSWIEGFGIPILEAMTCGAPVIASDRGSIPEVAGGAALITDAEDEVAFARHLTNVLTDTTLVQRLREQGFHRAADFSWDKTAQTIMGVYQRAANRDSHN